MNRLLSSLPLVICLACPAAHAGAISITQDVTGQYVFCELCPSPTKKILDLPEPQPAALAMAPDATSSLPVAPPASTPSPARAQVLFKLNSAALLPSARRILDALVPQASTVSKIVITGHTDKVGKRAVNERLAAARAASVKAYLIKKGISAERIRTGAGCCIDHPPSWNPPARRVDIEVMQ